MLWRRMSPHRCREHMCGDTPAVDRELVIADRELFGHRQGAIGHLNRNHLSAFEDNNGFPHIEIDGRDCERTVPCNEDRFDGWNVPSNTGCCLDNGPLGVKRLACHRRYNSQEIRLGHRLRIPPRIDPG